MDRTFDMRVMAFLDGSMDGIERTSFLREVHASPDKMDILMQYRNLESAFDLSRRPIDVPITLQQTLANRLPVLGGTLLPSDPAATNEVRAPIAVRKKSWLAALAVALLLLSAISYISMEPRAPSEGAIPGKARGAVSAESRTALSEKAGDVESSRTARSSARGSERVADPANLNSGSTAALNGRTSLAIAVETTAADDHPFSSPPLAETVVYPISRIGTSPELPFVSTVSGTEIPAFRYGTSNPDITVYAQSGLMQSLMYETAGQSREGTPVVLHAGVRYDLTPRFSAMFEIGRSTFLQETLYERRNALVGGNNTDLLVIDRAVIPDVRNWLRFQLGYQLIEMAAWRIEVRGGSGVLLGEEQAIVFTTGLMAQYALSRILQAYIGLQFSGARMAPGQSLPSDVSAGDEIVGIIRNASSARGITSTALEFNLGFGLRLW